MCEACGCAIVREPLDRPVHAHAHGHGEVQLMVRLLSANDRTAAHNREHFDAHDVAVFNLMSSPGAGKTALLEATAEALQHEFSMAVIVGDLETENDAKRIRARGVPAVQVTTGGACHLDARMIHDAVHDLSLDRLDLLFIENIGNLVCPASFDLGQHRNVVLLSVAEGDDKPAKYPVMFRAADLVLVSKIDLAPIMDDFDLTRAENSTRALANAAPLIPLSARKGINLDSWFSWLRNEVGRIRSRMPLPAGKVEQRHEPDTTVA